MALGEDTGTFELHMQGLETYEDAAEALEQVAREVGYGNDKGTILSEDRATIGEWRFHE